MTTRRRIGVYGGTFDPIHIGHLAAADDTAAQMGLDQVLFVPNRTPPHKPGRPISSAEDRLAMVRRAIEGNERFALSTVELEREGPSYTLDTMRQLSDRMPDVDLYFLAGCDSLADLHTWHGPDELLAEFRLVVMDRPTDSAVDWRKVEQRFPGIRERVLVVQIPMLQISARDIRTRVAEGRPYRYYVTEQVDEYIRAHGLYRGDARPGG